MCSHEKLSSKNRPFKICQLKVSMENWRHPRHRHSSHAWRTEVPPREYTTAPISNMKIIIFHELVDRFSHRPRFPAAPRPNYRRLTIRHRDDSKKSTHPSPTRQPKPAASRFHEHFYKNAETDRDRPARSRRATTQPAPFVSFPLFTRRRGRHQGGGGDRANAKY